MKNTANYNNKALRYEVLSACQKSPCFLVESRDKIMQIEDEEEKKVETRK